VAAVLVVVAVPAEADAVLAGTPARPAALGPYQAAVAGELTVLAGGVGPARAAAAAGTALTVRRFDLVVSAGVGGGFAGRAAVGDLVLADRVVHADLGAGSPDGFLPVDRLGFGAAETVLDAGLVARAAAGLEGTGAVVGPVVTVSTVTGTAQRAAELVAAHRPAAEAMEGAGVLAAAEAHGVPFLELRAISNPVGPRDRAGWDLAGALARLGPALRALAGSAVPIGGGR
jgi:futalosine hydrolase